MQGWGDTQGGPTPSQGEGKEDYGEELCEGVSWRVGAVTGMLSK